MERKQFWPNKRRDEIYATTEISLFLFSVFHFRDFERIIGSIYKIRGKHRDRGFVSSSVYPCGNEKRRGGGQFAIVFAVQFVTRAIRLVKEAPGPGFRPRPPAFSYVRGVERERERERERRRVSVLAAISFPKRRTESPLTCQPAIIIAGNGSTPFFSSGNPDSSFSSSTVF